MIRFVGFLAISAVVIITIMGMIMFLPKQTGVYYNCSIAEISPDIPPAVKEQCRKLNTQHTK